MGRGTAGICKQETRDHHLSMRQVQIQTKAIKQDEKGHLITLYQLLPFTK